MNNAFALVFAEQGNPQLGELISNRATAALHIGGTYRMIDVLLSNLTNSGVRTVGLITQANYESLMGHIGSGKDWGLAKMEGGIRFLPPYDLSATSGLYNGSCDAIFGKRDYIEHRRQPYCLVMRTDTLYRQDYNEMMDLHGNSGADITLLYSRDDRNNLDRTTVGTYLQVENGQVHDVYRGATPPAGYFMDLGVCLIGKNLLSQLVEEACASGHYEFSEDLLKPATRSYKVMALEHHGFEARLTTVKSYFDLNKDLLDRNIRHEVFNAESPVYTTTPNMPPAHFMKGCEVSGSVFGSGCLIYGRVKGSTLFRNVTIEEGADVENCVIMKNTTVKSGATLRNMIVDKNVVVENDARCFALPYNPGIIDQNTVVKGHLRV